MNGHTDAPTTGPTANGSPIDETGKLFARIRALLAKAEATSFEAEAAAFEAKAQELMARHGIDEALLAADGLRSDETVEARRIVIGGAHLLLRATLVHQIARANRCKAIRLGRVSAPKGWETIEIFGYHSDVVWVADLLVPRILAHLDDSLRTHRPAGLGAGESATWARSFISSYALEVSARLKAANAAAQQEREQAMRDTGKPVTSVALALRDRAQAVDDAFRTSHPHIRTSRSRGSNWSSAGGQSGRAAGSTAPIAKEELRTRRAIGSGR